MYAPQDTSKIEQKNPKITLPEEVKFYVGSEKSNNNFLTQESGTVRITRSLKEIVENSDLFKEEDKRRFVFE